MCCSYEIGQESDIKFSNLFYYPEIEKYGAKENFAFKTKDFKGKEITDYYSGYPVCKFFGKILRVEQSFENGGAPFMIGVNSHIDFLLENNNSEKFHIKNIFYQTKFIGENQNILDKKIPYVGEEIYGILTKGFRNEKIELLKYFQNEKDFLKEETEIPFCEREEKVLEKNIIQISEKNFEENKSFEINFHFFYIFIIFVLVLIIGFLVYKRKK